MEIIVRKPTEEEIKQAESWPTWSRGVSEFPWSYSDTETCLILKGKGEVVSEDGSKVTFGAGDWVVFPQGLNCTWKITEDIEKKYNFS